MKHVSFISVLSVISVAMSSPVLGDPLSDTKVLADAFMAETCTNEFEEVRKAYVDVYPDTAFAGVGAPGEYDLEVPFVDQMWAMIVGGLRPASVSSDEQLVTLHEAMWVAASSQQVGIWMAAQTTLFAGELFSPDKIKMLEASTDLIVCLDIGPVSENSVLYDAYNEYTIEREGLGASFGLDSNTIIGTSYEFVALYSNSSEGKNE